MSKISVLLTTYNGEKFIKEQLISIVHQTLNKDITLYIRDDGSTDKTVDIINSYKNKINIILKRGENLGPAKSFWNLLLDPAIESDYYAFCDQDDIWDSNKLELEIDKLKSGYSLVACNCRLIDSKGNVIINKMTNKDDIVCKLENMFVGGLLQGTSMVFDNELRNALINSTINYIPMHDTIVAFYACALKLPIFYIDEPLFSYRVHENNVEMKNGQKGIYGIFKTLKRWKNKSKNSMALVSKEMLENLPQLDTDTQELLTIVSKYKKSLKAKKQLLQLSKKYKRSKGVKRSFVMRVILNLF